MIPEGKPGHCTRTKQHSRGSGGECPDSRGQRVLVQLSDSGCRGCGPGDCVSNLSSHQVTMSVQGQAPFKASTHLSWFLLVSAGSSIFCVSSAQGSLGLGFVEDLLMVVVVAGLCGSLLVYNVKKQQFCVTKEPDNKIKELHVGSEAVASI